jgi:hypothetical protein
MKAYICVSVNMFQLLRSGRQFDSSDIQRTIFIRSHVRTFFQKDEAESDKKCWNLSAKNASVGLQYFFIA